MWIRYWRGNDFAVGSRIHRRYADHNFHYRGQCRHPEQHGRVGEWIRRFTLSVGV